MSHFSLFVVFFVFVFITVKQEPIIEIEGLKQQYSVVIICLSRKAELHHVDQGSSTRFRRVAISS